MNEEIPSEIRNKLTAPKIALEKLAKGERVPREFLELAAEELEAAVTLLQVAGRKDNCFTRGEPLY